LFVGCFTAHQHLAQIGPTLSGDKQYIRRGIATSRLLRQAGLGRGSILPTLYSLLMFKLFQVTLKRFVTAIEIIQQLLEDRSTTLQPPTRHILLPNCLRDER
jgi:hypothetical protein